MKTLFGFGLVAAILLASIFRDDETMRAMSAHVVATSQAKRKKKGLAKLLSKVRSNIKAVAPAVTKILKKVAPVALGGAVGFMAGKLLQPKVKRPKPVEVAEEGGVVYQEAHAPYDEPAPISRAEIDMANAQGQPQGFFVRLWKALFG